MSDPNIPPLRQAQSPGFTLRAMGNMPLKTTQHFGIGNNAGTWRLNRFGQAEDFNERNHGFGFSLDLNSSGSSRVGMLRYKNSVYNNTTAIGLERDFIRTPKFNAFTMIGVATGYALPLTPVAGVGAQWMPLTIGKLEVGAFALAIPSINQMGDLGLAATIGMAARINNGQQHLQFGIDQQQRPALSVGLRF